ncbi:hypothetical protein PV10_09045 [Exophiala mesophila]|uniref:protein-tyrosine-phosphatase n=2 Tax=Exophiala mesophila TaxID=212818 RepID=A0A0D1Z2I1_EXOME|nr:uncharacterized protein PV10_09045 [Exophiala mesophila]KIV88119.1 hypothetical protein PV10_09045 [Exophiala mesophila]
MLYEVRNHAHDHQRKRSFDLVTNYHQLTNLRRCIRHEQAVTPRSVTFPEPQIIDLSPDRRTLSFQSLNMPVEVDSIMSTPFPTFITAVGTADRSLPKDMEDIPTLDTLNSDTQLLVTDAAPPSLSLQQSTQSLYHRDSITSMNSTSTNSSPTTTNSTFDSPLVMDPSPSSSPESANSNLPISPFTSLVLKTPQDQFVHHQKPKFIRPELPTPSAHLNGIPPENAKNVKNLSINMNSVLSPRPATSHGAETSFTLSAPTSPLKDTPRTGRRKPTNLTIRTPGFQQLSFPRGTDIPPTPSARPALLHMASSPALSSLASPTKPPPQGLFLPLPSTNNAFLGPNSASASDSSSSTKAGNGFLPGLREEDESRGLKSQETQETGYPNGPVLIYDEGLYLYLEPTAEEASKFDTVINVAKEVQCPFDKPRPDVTEPQTAISEMSFKSAWEWLPPNEASTPTTPRPRSTSQKQPEYLHIPWDHNSEILEDLYCLCRLIDARIKAGNKVLIHCQLGVSRSASLVIAYGLYRGYQSDFHSMYMSVKERSQWVGPNMSLIYQLADFRSRVVKGQYGEKSNKPNPSWWKFRGSTQGQPLWRAPTANEPAAMERSNTSLAQGQGARLPAVTVAPTVKLNKALPPVPLFPKEAPVGGTPSKLSQILGGIAKPNVVPMLEVEPKTDEPTSPLPPSPRPLPFREQFEHKHTLDVPIPPAKSPRLGLKIESPRMDLAMQDVPETPSLLSPRANEFRASPFGLVVAGDLATGQGRFSGLKRERIFSMPRHQVILPPTRRVVEEGAPICCDPRSPHQQGEGGEILRHIDEFL